MGSPGGGAEERPGRGDRKSNGGARSAFCISEPALIVGSSEAAQSIRQFVLDYGPSDGLDILLSGKIGTGKDHLARHLHWASVRRNMPFVPVNCGAVHSNLANTEFFGHEKGAYTGADWKKIGFLRLAHGGTLFLNEASELDLRMQSMLLDALQQRTAFPVGGDHAYTFDIRIIAASNLNIEEEVKKGRFRADLYSRLRVAHFRVPSLVERREDIIPLAEGFLRRYSTAFRKPLRSLSKEAQVCMVKYSWPYNVREIENEMKRLAAANATQVISASELDSRIRGEWASVGKRLEPLGIAQSIIMALNAEKGNYGRTALRLGISRWTLRRQIREWGIYPRFFSRDSGEDLSDPDDRIAHN